MGRGVRLLAPFTASRMPMHTVTDDAMKRRISAKWLMVLGAIGLSLLFPRQAKANGINIEAVAVAGIVVLVPLLAFEVFVEAIVLAIGLKVRYRKVLLVALGAKRGVAGGGHTG